MSVVTRTNLATNPTAASTTNFSAVAGPGGTAALTNQTTQGYSGSNFNRVMWSAATTSAGGGASYTQTGLSASAMMAHLIWVRASKAQTVNLAVQYLTSGGANDGGAVTGTNVSLTANTWTAVSVVAYTGPSTTQAVLTAQAASTGVTWASGDTFDLDAVLMEAPPTRTNLALNPAFRGTSGTVAVRTNLCTNPSFETSTTGWTANTGSPTLASDTAHAYVGSASMKMTSTVSSADIAVFFTATLNANTTYTLSYWVYSPDARTSFFDVAGTGWTPSGNASTSIPANTWTRVTATLTTPSTAPGSTTFYLHNGGGPTTVGTSLWLDAVLLEMAASPGSYFDGSTAASGDYAFAWNGPAGASTSAQTAKALTNWNARWFGSNGGAGAMFQTANGMNGGVALRKLWTVANTGATLDTGFNTPNITVTPNATYTISGWCRATIAAGASTSFVPYIVWYNSSNSVISTTPSTFNGVSVTPGVWTQASVTGTAPATASYAVFVFGPYNGAANMAAGDYLDFANILIEPATTLGTYFDGSLAQTASTLYAWLGAADASSSVAMTTPFTYFDGSLVSANGNVYAWTGTANASTSTDKIYQPWISLLQGSSPAPNVRVTYQDFDPGTNQINLWRTVDGVRRPVRGVRHHNVVGSDFVVDYEAALGRTVSYDIEILSGVCAGVVISTASTTITGAVAGWLSDPLSPGTAVPVYGDVGPNGEPGLDFDALAKWDYTSAVTKLVVAGTSEPVALIGQRQMNSSIDVNVSTLATNQSTALRNLLQQAAVVLFRPLPGWASGLPGLCYLAAQTVTEASVSEKWGGQVVSWKVKGDIVAPPAAQVTVPTVTYGSVAAEYATYAAFNAAHQGQTYLQVVESP